jgi:hypothetical protein
MDSALEFMDKPDDRFMTPDTLAWDLVMGNDRDDFTGVMQGFVSDDHGKYGANRHEQMADEFQILITIYMEMIFNILKSNHMGSLLNENGDVKEGVDLEVELATYRPDFCNYSVDDMTGLFRDKLAKIRYFLSVRDLTDFCSNDANDFGPGSEYYCKILLKDDGRSYSKNYFKKATHIPEGKRYTFLMKPDDNPTQKELKDFYAVVYLPPHVGDSDKTPRKIRVAFEKYNVISGNSHTAY